MVSGMHPYRVVMVGHFRHRSSPFTNSCVCLCVISLKISMNVRRYQVHVVTTKCATIPTGPTTATVTKDSVESLQSLFAKVTYVILLCVHVDMLHEFRQMWTSAAFLATT